MSENVGIPVTGGDEREKLAQMFERAVMSRVLWDDSVQFDVYDLSRDQCATVAAALRSIQPAPVAVASEEAKRLATEAENIVYNVRQWGPGELPGKHTMDLMLTTLDRCAAALRSVVPVPANDRDPYCESDEHARDEQANGRMCTHCIIERILEGLIPLGFNPEWGETDGSDPAESIVAIVYRGLGKLQDDEFHVSTSMEVCIEEAKEPDGWAVVDRSGALAPDDEDCQIIPVWRNKELALVERAIEGRGDVEPVYFGSVAATASVQERTSGNEGDAK